MTKNEDNSNTQTDEISTKESYLGQAWLVIVLSVVSAALLIWVDFSLRDKIAENRKRETYRQIPDLVPGSSEAQTQEISISDSKGRPVKIYLARGPQNENLGWVFPASGSGFGDNIALLVGLDINVEKINGIYVLDQKETPGLGNFITDYDRFRRHFENKSASEPLLVTKGKPIGNEVPALTGATISSQAVCDIVNSAVGEYRDSALRELQKLSTEEKNNPETNENF
ncbi:MAG: FMN-binding protein [Planctomycetia bacterium]|nr:FMN-binding protein [Planctomycetia bacterium]